MIKIRARRKCPHCKKRYYYYYSSSDREKVFKGKDENGSLASSVKVLSMFSYEVTVNCPECGEEETFIYTG